MMKQVTTPDNILQLGTILSVWAHPDDETFLAGGILTAAIRNGQRVVCLTATHGEAGIRDASRWPAEHMGEIRTQEVTSALSILGVTEHHWLDYRDGNCQDEPLLEAARRVADQITSIKPDTILTFGPDGWTGHPDHRAVSAWVARAVDIAGSSAHVYHVVETPDLYESYLKQADEKLNIFFNIDQPPLVIPEECAISFALPDEIQHKKYAALRAMPSQYKVLFDNFTEDFICEALAIEAYIAADHSHN